jgi:hypothetical protein
VVVKSMDYRRKRNSWARCRLHTFKVCAARATCALGSCKLLTDTVIICLLLRGLFLIIRAWTALLAEAFYLYHIYQNDPSTSCANANTVKEKEKEETNPVRYYVFISDSEKCPSPSGRWIGCGDIFRQPWIQEFAHPLDNPSQQEWSTGNRNILRTTKSTYSIDTYQC